MKKFYKVILLLIVFLFLSTFNPNKFISPFKDDNKFFQIKKIIVENNLLIEKENIQEKLNHVYNQNIFSIKRQDLEKSLKKVKFLEKIEVKKKYPNTIIVKIFEAKPVAILFKKKDKYLLDTSSNLIIYENGMNFSELPHVFGEGAENNFLYFLNQLKINNFAINKIKNFYYFQIGRWDLQLSDNKIIKFPHENIENIIKKSVELLSRKDFENYNIIDLRVADKIIVE